MYAFIRIVVLLVVRMVFVFRFKVIGKGNLPANGTYLLVCNHRSNMDPVFVGVSMPRQIGFLGKIELARVPLFGRLVQKLGMIPIDRNNSISRGKAAIVVSNELVAGKPMLVFPEGHRSRTAGLLPFDEGYLSIASRANVPIVPCAIRRSCGRVSVLFGRSIEAPSKNNRTETAQLVITAIQNMLSEKGEVN